MTRKQDRDIASRGEQDAVMRSDRVEMRRITADDVRNASVIDPDNFGQVAQTDTVVIHQVR